MASNSSIENDIASLREDLALLRSDLSSLVSSLKADAASNVSRTASKIDENVQDIYRSALKSGEQSAQQISRQIEEHPLLAIMLVLGAGYLGGRMSR